MASAAEVTNDEIGACGGGGCDDDFRAGPSGMPNGVATDFDDDDGSSPSKTGSKSSKNRPRPRCQYGADCYRKNPHHFNIYCHPADEEWSEGDENRPKPRCPFGAFCTRKNLRHQRYFHQSDDEDDGCGDVNNNNDDDDDAENARSITDADFHAVRPKTKNNYVGAKRSTPKKQGPFESTGPRLDAHPPNDRSPDSVALDGTSVTGSSTDRRGMHGSPDDSQFECGCCFTDCPIEDSVPCGEGHLFCRDCLKNYVQSILYGTGKSSLACLGPDCEASFSTANLYFIEPKLVQSLEERQQKEMLSTAFAGAKHEQLHRCPFCDFTCLVPVTIQVFRCFRCARESCQYCKVEWKKHVDYGYVCSDVEGDDESKVRLKTEEAMTSAFVRKCHKCSTPMLKESGCNKMTCRCGAHLCYVCHKPINGYDHFCQHTLAPGQPTCTVPGCGKCSSIDDPTPFDGKRVEEERLKGERERQQLGVIDRRQIGGDIQVASTPSVQPPYGPFGAVNRVVYF